MELLIILIRLLPLVSFAPSTSVDIDLLNAVLIQFQSSMCGKSWIIAVKLPAHAFLDLIGEQCDIPRMVVVNNFNTVGNMTYFNSEWLAEDILHNYYSTRILTNFCSVITLVADSAPAHIQLTNHLFSAKVARPHWDKFIYIGDTAEIRTLQNSDFPTKFRYVSFIVPEGLLQGQNKVGFNCLESYNICKSLYNGKKIIAATSATHERIRFKKDGDGNLVGTEGAIFEMVAAAGKTLNYSFIIVPGSVGGASGSKLPNGTWIGATGDVFYGHANFCMMVGAVEFRHYVLDWSQTTEYYARVFYIQIPPKGISWHAIYRPLDPTLWFLLFAAFLTVSICLYAVFEIGSRLKIRHRVLEPVASNNVFHSSIGGAMATMLKILLDQSSTSRSWMGFNIRTVLCAWTLFALLIGTGYRSKLMSSLTNPIPLKELPTTHTQLATSDFNLYFRSWRGAAYHAMISGKTETHQRIVRRMRLVFNSVECIQRALEDEKAACLAYDASADYTIAANFSLSASTSTRALFLKSKDSILKVMVSWGFPKGSPLTQDFSQVMLHVLEAGLYRHWIEADELRARVEGAKWAMQQHGSYTQSKFNQIYSSVKSNEGLSLSSFYGLCLILGVGTCISTLLFLAEQVKFLYGRRTSITYFFN